MRLEEVGGATLGQLDLSIDQVEALTLDRHPTQSHVQASTCGASMLTMISHGSTRIEARAALLRAVVDHCPALKGVNLSNGDQSAAKRRDLKAILAGRWPDEEHILDFDEWDSLLGEDEGDTWERDSEDDDGWCGHVLLY